MNMQSYELMSSKAHAMSICQNMAVESSRQGSHSRAHDEASMRRLASVTVAITTPTNAGLIMKDEVTL